jgi:hypothetical protein
LILIDQHVSALHWIAYSVDVLVKDRGAGPDFGGAAVNDEIALPIDADLTALMAYDRAVAVQKAAKGGEQYAGVPPLVREANNATDSPWSSQR